MIDVVNLQKSVSIDTAVYRNFVKLLTLNVPEATGHTFTVAFITDDRMKQLNQMFRSKDSTTDVLSFPHEPDEFDPDESNLGDIVISPDGRLIYVSDLFNNAIKVVNPQSGMVIENWKTARRPNRILFHPDGKTFFVSSWADGVILQHALNP